jgi:hypothetical protein
VNLTILKQGDGIMSNLALRWDAFNPLNKDSPSFSVLRMGNIHFAPELSFRR